MTDETNPTADGIAKAREALTAGDFEAVANILGEDVEAVREIAGQPTPAEDADPPLTNEEIRDFLTNLGLRMNRLETVLPELIAITDATSSWMAGVTTNRAQRRSVAMRSRRGGAGTYAGKAGRGRG